MTTNATMAVYYRTSFTVKGSTKLQGLKLLAAVSNTVFEWARETEPDVDDNIGLWRKEGRLMVRLYGGTLEDSNLGYYAMTFERSEEHDGLERVGVQDNSTWWDLKIQMATQDDDVSVTVEDECINGLAPLDEMSWPPEVVAELFEQFDCFLGDTPLNSRAKKIEDQDSALNFVRNEVFSTERLLPIIVVRDDIRNVSADKIQAYFRGQATVATFGEDAAWDVNVGLGRELACRAGAVRIYWPNCTPNDDPQVHRLFEPRNVVERLGDKLQLVLRDEFVSYFPSEEASILFNKARETFNDVSSQVQQEHLRLRRNELGENDDVDRILSELAGREDELNQENSRLRREIEHLTAENSQLKAENEQLGYWREYEDPFSETSKQGSSDDKQVYKMAKYTHRGNRRSPFDDWRNSLGSGDREQIDDVLERMREGNFGDTKTIRTGLKERRVDHGPGYRIYFTEDRGNVIVLLGGGDKESQGRDVDRMNHYLVLHKKQKVA